MAGTSIYSVQLGMHMKQYDIGLLDKYTTTYFREASYRFSISYVIRRCDEFERLGKEDRLSNVAAEWLVFVLST